MHCCVKSCEIRDDHFLWKCEFCSKSYHAACIGVHRQQEIYITRFMIPLCEECQHHLKSGIDTSKLLYDQKELISSIKQHTKVNTEIADDLKKLKTMSELFGHLEQQLKQLLTSVNQNTKTKVENAVSTILLDMEATKTAQTTEHIDIKNHITKLFDVSMAKTGDQIDGLATDLTTDLATDLKRIQDNVENLSVQTKDMAAQCSKKFSVQSRSTKEALDKVGGDVLIEVRSLGNAICNLEENIKNSRSQTVSPPSLMEELRDQSANLTEGWRMLGSKKVWRPDWTEYDARKLRRVQQQRAKDKSIKQRKANKKYWILNNKSNKTNNNTGSIDPNDSPTCSYYNYNSAKNITNSCTNHNIPSCSYHDYNSTRINHTNHKPVNNSLSDKQLLAAAKVTFSKPPVQTQHGVRFQRGEILNPYPADHQLPRVNMVSPINSPDLTGSTASSSASASSSTSASSISSQSLQSPPFAPCQACACKRSCFASY